MNRILISSILILLLFPVYSFAAGGTAPWFQSVMQQGEDVKVTFALGTEGEPGVGSNFTLERVSPDYTLFVFQDLLIELDDAIASSGIVCTWGDPEIPNWYCNTHPGECVDCDGDLDPECYGVCEEVLYFQFMDLCVPPGLTTYNLYGHPITGNPEDSKFITMDDVGQDCPEPTTDDDDDSDDDDDIISDDDDMTSDDDDDDDDNDDDDDGALDASDDGDNDSGGGCAITPGQPVDVFLLVMLFVGIIGYAISRKN